MAEPLSERPSYVNSGVMEMATKLKGSARTATGLAMVSQASPVGFPFEKMAQMALVSCDSGAERGRWVSEMEQIAAAMAVELSSLRGAAPARYLRQHSHRPLDVCHREDLKGTRRTWKTKRAIAVLC